MRVHRERASSDFLGIKNENWKSAARDLSPHALLLYLYLSSNADNYTFALSPAAVMLEIGMPRSTYHDQFKVLVNKGYLINTHGNTYDFYETPQPRPVIEDLNVQSSFGSNSPPDGFPMPQAGNSVLSEDIEINNNYKNNTINSIKNFEF